MQELENKLNFSIFPKHYFIKITLLLLLLIIIAVLAILSGSVNINIHEIINLLCDKTLVSEQNLFIIYQIRLPRILLSILVGSSLALSGMVLQGIFRNPLVDPFIVGISGGASLGAGLAILFELSFSLFGISSIPLFAFATSLIAMLIAYKLSIYEKKMYIDRLLLGGIAISSLSSSILSLLLVLKGKGLDAVIFWVMGSLSGKSWESISIVLPYIIVVNIIILFNLHKLNVLQLGDESAINLGLNVERLKIFLIIIASLLSAVIVSVSGIIGFIGLVVPQIARLFIKTSDFRALYVTVLLLGAIILLGADTVARLILMPQEIPVGIFTSILGVPFFLFLLKKAH